MTTKSTPLSGSSTTRCTPTVRRWSGRASSMGRSNPEGGAMSERIVFVCPHGAAKSVIAAAYCQQLADQWGVALHATSAGTEPDAEVSPAVVALLRTEGI